MAALLESQVSALRRVLKASRFRLASFEIDSEAASPTVRFSDRASSYFQWSGDHNERMRWRPGAEQVEETASHLASFDWKLRFVEAWLRNLQDQVSVYDQEGAVSEPAWVTASLPSRYLEVLSEIEKLEKERAEIVDAGRLLWETGDPLAAAVQRAVQEFGYTAALTAPGSTYDLEVKLDDSRRLLVEITGVEGPIAKKSNKIGQILQAVHHEARDEGDRVVLLANVHRTKPPSERLALESITPDALRLISRLGANFMTTSTLFELWRRDSTAAREQFERLFNQEGGIFTLGV